MFDFFFYFSAFIVLPFWLLMILLPNAKFTEKLIDSPWIIIPPTICYLYFLLPNILISLSAFKYPSPAIMSDLMVKPWAASMFWTYAGAFDLFIGRWIYFDAKESRITHWVISPILFISIFFGPLGFSLYGMVKLFINIFSGKRR